jgi:AmmeMemoRadiSam system protein B
VSGVTQPAGVRSAAVAGLFYPQDPQALRCMLEDCLAAAPQAGRAAIAEAMPKRNLRPKALIAPHAGYVYSGSIAASAYRTLVGHAIRRVVLIGPSHFVPFRGLALPQAEAFETPLGVVPIDDAARRDVLGAPHVIATDEPHAREHSLEVQLPFLQVLLGEFTVLPIAAGDATPKEVAVVLDCVWGGADTLIVVSSDLSHYLEYAAARRTDTATSEAILNYSTALDGEQACGYVGINGLMHTARQRRLEVRRLDIRNSGDTSAERSRVVGYGAFALHEVEGGSHPIQH